MNAVDEILSQIPIGQLAEQLGVDETAAEQAARQALPALLGGMQANAADPQGAASLERALGQHLGTSPGGLDLRNVDTTDGDQIVGHIFGDNREQVVNRLGARGAGEGLMGKLLPMLAPLVLSWLAGKFLGGGQKTPAGGATTTSSGGGLEDLLPGAGGGASGGGGLGDLLGGILGGGGSTSGTQAGQDSITDILEGLLGGGRR